MDNKTTIFNVKELRQELILMTINEVIEALEFKGYNATNWAENDVITNGKLNKIEDALTYLMSNDVSMISPVGNVLTLKEEKLQVSEISKTTTIVLPAINYVADFVLFLNCTMDLDVIFQSSADTQKITLAKGYHKINFKFISDWLISC